MVSGLILSLFPKSMDVAGNSDLRDFFVDYLRMGVHHLIDAGPDPPVFQALNADVD